MHQRKNALVSTNDISLQEKVSGVKLPTSLGVSTLNKNEGKYPVQEKVSAYFNSKKKKNKLQIVIMKTFNRTKV